MTLWPEIDAFVPMPKPTLHLVRFDDEPRAERRPVFIRGYSFGAGTLGVKVGERWVPATTVRHDRETVVVRRSEPPTEAA